MLVLMSSCAMSTCPHVLMCSCGQVLKVAGVSDDIITQDYHSTELLQLVPSAYLDTLPRAVRYVVKAGRAVFWAVCDTVLCRHVAEHATFLAVCDCLCG